MAGAAVAQEGLIHLYLPKEYSEAYIPTRAEWQALQLTAHENDEGRLTSRLLKRSCSAMARGSYLDLIVDTDTPPGWNTCYAREMVQEHGYENRDVSLVPDRRAEIARTIERLYQQLR